MSEPRRTVESMSEQTGPTTPDQPESTGETLGSSEPVDNPALEKDPSDWTTGDEPMTGAQASYLKTLSEEAGDADAYDETLTKAQASQAIDALQAKTGRGDPSD